MPEYSELKNADLQALLKERGLPTGGKKADMVERLTKNDEDKKATAPAKTNILHPEDEIDWDDDDDVPVKPAADAPTVKPSTEAPPAKPAAKPAIKPAVAEATNVTVAKAGGKGAIDNPQSVPNQKASIDPSKTQDLSIKTPAIDKAEVDGTNVEEKKEAPEDYSRGLAATDIDKEIEKRKARAKKFGMNIEDDEGLKKLERMKKFGDKAPPKGLDEALPERSRKRGRDGDDDDSRNKRHGGKFGGRRGGRGPRDGDRRRDNRREENTKPSNGGPRWMSDADKAKLEARKNRFTASG